MCTRVRSRHDLIRPGALFHDHLVFLKVSVASEQTRKACYVQIVRSRIDPIGKHLCFPKPLWEPRCTQPAAGGLSVERWLVLGIQIILFHGTFLQTFPAFSLWPPGSGSAAEAGGVGGRLGMPWRGE